MVQVIELQGSPWARIGKAVGESLGSQIPKEVEKHGLASGLQKIKEMPNADPLDRLIELYKIGASPEVINQVEPYLRRSAIQKEGPISSNKPVKSAMPREVQNTPREMSMSRSIQNIEQPQAARFTNEKQNAPPIREQKPANFYDKSFKALTNSEDIINQPLPIWSQDQREQRKHQLAQEHPERFPGGIDDPNLQNFVNQEESTDLKKFEASQMKRQNDIGLQNAYETTFSNRLQEGLQKINLPDIWNKIPGEVIQTFKQRGLDKVRDGIETPETAGQNMAQEAMTFAKRRSTLADLGHNVITGGDENLWKDLEKFRDTYEDANALPLLVADMVNFNGLGDHKASSKAYPESEDIYNSIPDLKKTNPKYVKTGEIIKNVVDNWSPTQSIFSIALDANEKGWNDEEFVERLGTALAGKMTAYQQEEFQRYYPLNYTLGDILTSSVMEVFGHKGKLSAIEKRRRYLRGKK